MDTTTTSAPSAVRRHSRRSTVGWTLAVVSTAVTGFVVGYGAVWFQLFGDSADAEDYQVSAGGYATAGFLLLLAVPALVVASRRMLVAVTATIGGLYLLLALDSASAAQAAEPGPGINTALDGVGGVVLSPTTWPLLVLSLLVVRRFHRSPVQAQRD